MTYILFTTKATQNYASDVKEVAAEMGVKLNHVDVDDNHHAAAFYGVTKVPVLIKAKGDTGDVIDSLLGVHGKPAIRSFFQ